MHTFVMKNTYITHLRTNHRLNQKQFAELLGVDQATVSRWENGAKIKGSALKLIELLFNDSQTSQHEEHAA